MTAKEYLKERHPQMRITEHNDYIIDWATEAMEAYAHHIAEKVANEVSRRKCGVCSEGGWKECGCHTDGVKAGAKEVLSRTKQLTGADHIADISKKVEAKQLTKP